MGMYCMVINGVGAHHNPNHSNDADKLFREFVAKLKKVGHTVEHASFTHGGRETIVEELAVLQAGLAWTL